MARRTSREIAHKRLVESEASKIITSAQPFIIMVFTMLLAAIFHKIWVHSPHFNLIILGLILAVLGLSYFTWETSRSRRDIGRIHSVVTMLAAGGWIVWATALGPTTNPLLDIWILGGISLAFSWTIRNGIHKGPDRVDSMADFWENVGLEGTKTTFKERSANRIKGTIRVKAGKYTSEDVKKVRHKLASLFKVPLNGVRILSSPDDSTQADFTIVRKDMLKEVVPYAVTSESESIADPIEIGVYEDSEPVKFWLQTPDLGAVHLLIQGMNGSGKSAGAQVFLAELFKRRNVISWVIDTVKGTQTLYNARQGIDWIISDENVANKLFKKFRDIVKARADHLGQLQLDKWEPGCGLSFLHIHIEEASGLIANNPSFIKMMETCRSVGIQITASLQRASFVSIDTAARAQFSAVLCFGVADISDADFALPDDVLEAGANPAIWRNSRPGYAYLVAPGVDSERWTIPLRTFLISKEQLANQAAEAKKEPLDPITLAAIGGMYKTDTAIEQDIEDWEKELEEVNLDDLEAESGNMEDDILISDNSFDIPTASGVTPEEAKQMLIERIEQFKAEGRSKFSAPDVSDIVVKAGRSRAWVHKTLKKMIDDGVLERDSFDYIIL